MQHSPHHFFSHDGLNFRYLDLGDGIPFIFQHGLGGDVNQPFGLFKPPKGFWLISFDCRGHGETRPLGNPEKIGIASFADDLLSLMDHLNIQRAIIGGVSMGAAVSLNFALRFPDRIIGLLLSRPAWLDAPNQKNAKIYSHIASLIRTHGAKRGTELFQQTEDYLEILRQAPDAANSLLGQFESPRAEETVIKLERIPNEAPNYDRQEWRKIKVPTLILASRWDPIHPFEYGKILAELIPKAEFKELTPKSISKEQHAKEVQMFIEKFLRIDICL